MKRFYAITWFSLKDRNHLQRTTYVQVVKPTGKTSIDAKTALDIFCSEYGNLSKNEITCIKELDENYKQIGEDIKPTGENGMIPTIRKRA